MNTSLRIQNVTLRVSDLARSIDYYSRQLGFVVIDRNAAQVDLATQSAAAPILRLVQDPGAIAAPPNTAGLFHVALLFPSRANLGSWLRRAAERNVIFDGFSDHAVSEAIYFSDPDGNGLEFYSDRPHETWPISNGQVGMTTRTLDVQSLLGAARETDASPLADCRWGHLHLRVTSLDRSEEFYRQSLGVEVTQRTFPGARFLAADGYHHHVGLNVWGQPRHPQPAGTLGLVEVAFSRRGATPTKQRDPDGIALRIEPRPDETR